MRLVKVIIVLVLLCLGIYAAHQGLEAGNLTVAVAGFGLYAAVVATIFGALALMSRNYPHL